MHTQFSITKFLGSNLVNGQIASLGELHGA